MLLKLAPAGRSVPEATVNTLPWKIRLGSASTETSAGWPALAFTTSSSPTFSSAIISERSEITINTAPARLVCPAMAISPFSAFRPVTWPAMGARITVFESRSWAWANAASA